jgi:hypothetical protein
LGAPETGAGGASHSDDDAFLALAGLALLGAGLALAQAIGRRRALTGSGYPHSGEPGKDE